jgi:glycosyltransferase involved in cell wall biosynthesis
MPLISVIIPAYNNEKTIRETIESVLNQSFRDWEIIIINDCSTDSTLEIISSIQDDRIKVFSYPNAGVSVSRNRGFYLSKGEFIAFLDADDLWTPDKLESQLKALQANPQAAIAYSWIDRIDESGKFVTKGNYKNFSGNIYPHLIVQNFLETASNALIRAEALKAVGNFDSALTPAEDWDMYLRLAENYHFVVVPRPQILYRLTANSQSTNMLKMEAVGRKIREKIADRAPESLQNINKAAIKKRYKYYTYKLIEGLPERENGLIAIGFLGQAIKHDAAFLKTRVFWKVLLKIAVIILMPKQITAFLLKRYQNLFNTQALLIHINKDLPAEFN